MLTITVITPIVFWTRVQFPNKVGRVTRPSTFQPVTVFTLLLVTGQDIQVVNAETLLVIQQCLQIVVVILVSTVRETIFAFFEDFLCEKVLVDQFTDMRLFAFERVFHIGNPCERQAFDDLIVQLEKSRCFVAVCEFLSALIE